MFLDVRTRSAGTFAAALTLVASLASGQGPAPIPATPATPAITPIDPPAPPGSTLPALAAEGPTTFNREPEVLLTWLEPGERGGRLKFARLSGRSWSPPVTVAEQVSTLEPADAPSLTVIETRGVRRTLLARTGDVVARSGDGGRSWTRLAAPALPSASFAGGDEGAFAFWLGSGEGGSAKLLGTRVLAGETLLDPRVSAGSATSAAMTWDGPVVVYHDRGASDAREIAIVRRQDARWTDPRPVHGEERRPAGTPGSGLQVAALRRQVAVAWVAEAPRGPRLLVAFSSDAGRTFGAPVEVDAEGGPRPSGAVAVALDEGGHALVLWTAVRGRAEAALHLARVSPDGRRGPALVLAKGPSARPMDVPQIARAGGQVAVAWIEGSAAGLPGRVRAATVPVADVPAVGSRRAGPAVASRRASGAYSGRGRVGDPVPGFELVSLDGGEVSLESLQGRAVLLNLWATWCLPCLAEMPELAALQERFGEQGLVVVGLNVDDAEAVDRVRAFVAERKLPFEVWLDPEMRVHGALRVRALPATFVIDREGRIVLRRDRVIAADDPEIEKALGRALSGPRGTDAPRPR